VLPAILGGCRIALGSSYLTVIGAEFLIRQAGIGTLLFSAMDEGRFPAVWAIGLLIGTVGVLLDLAFVVGAHRVVRWYEGEL
jgi:NitT/TauT family transport system permease protein